MKRVFAGMLSALFVVLAAGCGAPAQSGQTAAPVQSTAPVQSSAAGDEKEPVTLLLAAAASLEKSFSEALIPAFTEHYPWITVEGTYDSSGKLQAQIEAGLTASVFMSAAEKQMNALADSGLIDAESVVKLLENELVLIVPAGQDSAVRAFADLAEAEVIAIGDPDSVPAGQYAKEVLTHFGIWDAVLSKASLGTNVTEVLNAVAEGSADAGIVYATDARQLEGRVDVVDTAPAGSLKSPVIYPVGILRDAPEAEAAALLVEFLQSPEALAVFEKKGFRAYAG